MLKNLVKFGLIGCGSLVMLVILLVAGLLAWDYVDQKLAERQEKAAAVSTEASVPAPSA